MAVDADLMPKLCKSSASVPCIECGALAFGSQWWLRCLGCVRRCKFSCVERVNAGWTWLLVVDLVSGVMEIGSVESGGHASSVYGGSVYRSVWFVCVSVTMVKAVDGPVMM